MTFKHDLVFFFQSENESHVDNTVNTVSIKFLHEIKTVFENSNKIALR